MSVLFVVYLLFAPYNASQPTECYQPDVVQTSTTPESEHNSLSNKATVLIRRAMAESNDDKALAILQGVEGNQLVKWWQQFQPAFNKWLNTLSSVQRQAFAQRMMKSNSLMKYMQSIEHDTKANARIERNPKLAAAFMKVANMDQAQ